MLPYPSCSTRPRFSGRVPWRPWNSFRVAVSDLALRSAVQAGQYGTSAMSAGQEVSAGRMLRRHLAVSVNWPITDQESRRLVVDTLGTEFPTLLWRGGLPVLA